MTKRCYYLDLAKVIATFLVILGHLYSEDSTLRLYLYSFHMPLFFLVSGVFHKVTGRINWKLYVKTLLWPTLVCIILHTLTGLIFSHFSLNSIHSYLNSFFVDLPLGRHKEIFWFIFALLWCKVFMDLWFIIRRPILFATLWLLLLMVPILLNARLPFEMTQGLMAFPFYFIGSRFNTFFLDRKPSFRYLLPLIVCLALNILITKLHGRVSMMSVHFGQFARQFGFEPASLSIPARLSFLGGDVLLFYLNGLIGSVAILSLALLPAPKLSLITQLAKSLITVLGTQYLLISPLVHYIGFDHPLWASALLSISIFIVCYLIHQVLRPVYNLVR